MRSDQSITNEIYERVDENALDRQKFIGNEIMCSTPQDRWTLWINIILFIHADVDVDFNPNANTNRCPLRIDIMLREHKIIFHSRCAANSLHAFQKIAY